MDNVGLILDSFNSDHLKDHKKSIKSSQKVHQIITKSPSNHHKKSIKSSQKSLETTF
jgi:hypothetical protein